MDLSQELRRYDALVNSLREREYPMLKSTTYLDHAGTTLPSRSLIDAFSTDILSMLVSNPHSASSSSQATSQIIDDIRVRVLQFFGADPDHFDVIFLANATAAIKLVAEAFQNNAQGFWYGYHKDAHTSIVGVRELAIRGSNCFKSDQAVESWLNGSTGVDLPPSAPILFAYPGQSNMNGRKLVCAWPGRLRKYRSDAFTLLDAAALVATSSLDLSDPDQAPDFISLSFYKIFGFPDLGALIVRKKAARVFETRRYFGGGTVDFVACFDEQWHISKSKSLHDKIEDGTLPLRSIIALRCALNTHEQLYESQAKVSRHTSFLAQELYENMRKLEHGNGQPVFTIYKDFRSNYNDPKTQGPIIAFNLHDSRGSYYSCHEFSKLAAVNDIHLRTGTLCNPGGVADALGTSPQDLRESFDAGVRCGSGDDVRNERPLAMARVSLGASNTMKDIENFMRFVEEFIVERPSVTAQTFNMREKRAQYSVESITIYPIKSCSGWLVPPGEEWPIWEEGLGWDRLWCILHQGTKSYLNQKRCPLMALMRPTLDLNAGFLHITFVGPLDRAVPSSISIPLIKLQPSREENYMQDTKRHSQSISVQPEVIYDSHVTEFFSVHLGLPCYLARLPLSAVSQGVVQTFIQTSRIQKDDIAVPSPSTSRLKLPGAFETPPSAPSSTCRNLSNESPILAISRSSLEHLNQFRSQNPKMSGYNGTHSYIEPKSFRANLVLAPRDMRNAESSNTQPFEEESWSKMRIFRPHAKDRTFCDAKPVLVADLEVSGRCRRCQMICVNQESGIRWPDPFTTLAKLRPGEGGVFFGIHCNPLKNIETDMQVTSSLCVGDWVEGVSSTLPYDQG